MLAICFNKIYREVTPLALRPFAPRLLPSSWSHPESSWFLEVILGSFKPFFGHLGVQESSWVNPGIIME